MQLTKRKKRKILQSSLALTGGVAGVTATVQHASADSSSAVANFAQKNARSVSNAGSGVWTSTGVSDCDVLQHDNSANQDRSEKVNNALNNIVANGKGCIKVSDVLLDSDDATEANLDRVKALIDEYNVLAHALETQKASNLGITGMLPESVQHLQVEVNQSTSLTEAIRLLEQCIGQVKSVKADNQKIIDDNANKDNKSAMVEAVARANQAISRGFQSNAVGPSGIDGIMQRLSEKGNESKKKQVNGGLGLQVDTSKTERINCVTEERTFAPNVKVESQADVNRELQRILAEINKNGSDVQAVASKAAKYKEHMFQNTDKINDWLDAIRTRCKNNKTKVDSVQAAGEAKAKATKDAVEAMKKKIKDHVTAMKTEIEAERTKFLAEKDFSKETKDKFEKVCNDAIAILDKCEMKAAQDLGIVSMSDLVDAGNDLKDVDFGDIGKRLFAEIEAQYNKLTNDFEKNVTDGINDFNKDVKAKNDEATTTNNKADGDIDAQKKSNTDTLKDWKKKIDEIIKEGAGGQLLDEEWVKTHTDLYPDVRSGYASYIKNVLKRSGVASTKPESYIDSALGHEMKISKIHEAHTVQAALATLVKKATKSSAVSGSVLLRHTDMNKGNALKIDTSNVFADSKTYANGNVKRMVVDFMKLTEFSGSGSYHYDMNTSAETLRSTGDKNFGPNATIQWVYDVFRQYLADPKLADNVRVVLTRTPELDITLPKAFIYSDPDKKGIQDADVKIHLTQTKQNGHQYESASKNAYGQSFFAWWFSVDPETGSLVAGGGYTLFSNWDAGTTGGVPGGTSEGNKRSLLRSVSYMDRLEDAMAHRNQGHHVFQIDKNQDPDCAASYAGGIRLGLNIEVEKNGTAEEKKACHNAAALASLFVGDVVNNQSIGLGSSAVGNADGYYKIYSKDHFKNNKGGSGNPSMSVDNDVDDFGLVVFNPKGGLNNMSVGLSHETPAGVANYSAIDIRLFTPLGIPGEEPDIPKLDLKKIIEQGKIFNVEGAKVDYKADAKAHTDGQYTVKTWIQYLTCKNAVFSRINMIDLQLILAKYKEANAGESRASSGDSLIVRQLPDQYNRTSSGNSLVVRILDGNRVSSGNSLVVRELEGNRTSSGNSLVVTELNDNRTSSGNSLVVREVNGNRTSSGNSLVVREMSKESKAVAQYVKLKEAKDNIGKNWI